MSCSRFYWERFQVFSVEYYVGCVFINSCHYFEICSVYTHCGKSYFLLWMHVKFYLMLFLNLLRWLCSFYPFFSWYGVSRSPNFLLRAAFVASCRFLYGCVFICIKVFFNFLFDFIVDPLVLCSLCLLFSIYAVISFCVCMCACVRVCVCVCVYVCVFDF